MKSFFMEMWCDDCESVVEIDRQGFGGDPLCPVCHSTNLKQFENPQKNDPDYSGIGKGLGNYR